MPSMCTKGLSTLMMAARATACASARRAAFLGPDASSATWRHDK